uniref:Uncharacterized protein n=1 Tax=Vitis vinifera TaxID=29760 RepID=F6I5I2_VITVI
MGWSGRAFPKKLHKHMHTHTCKQSNLFVGSCEYTNACRLHIYLPYLFIFIFL